jgi:hypothetical protein
MPLKHLNLRYGVYEILDLISVLGFWVLTSCKYQKTSNWATHEEQNCILIQLNAFHLSFFLEDFFNV